jgi:hypothetical protein
MSMHDEHDTLDEHKHVEPTGEVAAAAQAPQPTNEEELAADDDIDGGYMSRVDPGWERSEVAASLRQQLQQERAWTRALIAQVSDRLAHAP